ncbi:MAG: CHASE2 domain-containing protein [Proteobacteria bacterium]|nr:CHASE2 domain-containing protein [Pseudomonadota bacterium]
MLSNEDHSEINKETVFSNNGDYYESLSLSMVRALLEVDTVLPIFERFNEKNSGYYEFEWLQVGDLKIPVDEHIQSLIPYRGKQGSFKYISAVDVLNGHIKKSELQDRIVLAGTSAPGLFDLRSTPVQNKYPGVEIHANMIAGIIDESIKLKPTFTLGAEFIQILLIGVLLSFIIPCISPLIANFVFGISLAIIVCLNYLAWEEGNLVFPIASLMMMLLIMYLFNMTFGFFIEQRSKRRISGLFGQYIPTRISR